MAASRLLILLVVPAIGLSGAAGAAPPEPAQAGDPVSYTDLADDAYRLTLPDGSSAPAGVPDAARSIAPLDVLQVDWAPAANAHKRKGSGYVTSITVKGTASRDGSYVSYGHFTFGGDDCQLYHFLTPGITAFANAFCGTLEDGDRVFVGRVSGSRVVATTTTGGGTVLSAVFDNSRLPEELRAAGSTLHALAAFTCWQGDEGLGCRPYETQDAASSHLSYKLA